MGQKQKAPGASSPSQNVTRDFGPKPMLAWLPIDKVSVDAKYQRDTGSRRSRNLIEKIAANFRWSRFGVVLAVKHAGGWHVIDGQHRVEACRLCGIKQVPAVVLPHATVEEAAADFVAINRDRVAVTPLHIHHAQLAAGDPEAKAIERACRAAGVEICRYPVPANKMQPRQTLAVATIHRLIRLRDEKFATAVLTKIIRAPGGGTAGRRKRQVDPLRRGEHGLVSRDSPAGQRRRRRQGVPQLRSTFRQRRPAQPHVPAMQGGRVRPA